MKGKFASVTVIIPVLPKKDANVVIESLKKVDYPKEKIGGYEPALVRDVYFKTMMRFRGVKRTTT